MTDKKDQGQPSLEPRCAPTDAARQRRLAAALRENLKRRKAQARARTGKDREPTPGDAD